MRPPRAPTEVVTSSDRRHWRPELPLQASGSSLVSARRRHLVWDRTSHRPGAPCGRGSHRFGPCGEPQHPARLGHARPRHVRRKLGGGARGGSVPPFAAPLRVVVAAPWPAQLASDPRRCCASGLLSLRPPGPAGPTAEAVRSKRPCRLQEQLSLRDRQQLGVRPVSGSGPCCAHRLGFLSRGARQLTEVSDDPTFEALLRRQAFRSPLAFPPQTIHVLPWAVVPFEAFRPSPLRPLARVRSPSGAEAPSRAREASFPNCGKVAARASLPRVRSVRVGRRRLPTRFRRPRPAGATSRGSPSSMGFSTSKSARPLAFRRDRRVVPAARQGGSLLGRASGDRLRLGSLHTPCQLLRNG